MRHDSRVWSVANWLLQRLQRVWTNNHRHRKRPGIEIKLLLRAQILIKEKWETEQPAHGRKLSPIASRHLSKLLAASQSHVAGTE